MIQSQHQLVNILLPASLPLCLISPNLQLSIIPARYPQDLDVELVRADYTLSRLTQNPLIATYDFMKAELNEYTLI
jgi:hypothetical protein